MITLQRITKIFELNDRSKSAEEKRFYALDDVSLEIPDGSIFGIIGRSGAGKSTLIRCINMLERPSSGRVFVGGTEMTALSGAALRAARRKIGMIFQHFSLLANRTVYGNIAFPLELEKMDRRLIDERVREIASLVEIESKLDQYPSQLSGGQKQRVGIARALANKPDILLSDEATSALDPQTTTQVLRLIRDLSERLGVTVVLITHEMNVIKEICDRVAVIDAGKVVEEGEVLKVFTQPVKQITKDLLRSVISSELPESFAGLQFTKGNERIKNADILLRLSFFGELAAEPFISSLARKFDVDVNILTAHIDHVRNTPFGTLTLQLSGEDVEEALEYMLDMHVRLEVIGYVERTR